MGFPLVGKHCKCRSAARKKASTAVVDTGDFPTCDKGILRWHCSRVSSCCVRAHCHWKLLLFCRQRDHRRKPSDHNGWERRERLGLRLQIEPTDKHLWKSFRPRAQDEVRTTAGQLCCKVVPSKSGPNSGIIGRTPTPSSMFHGTESSPPSP